MNNTEPLKTQKRILEILLNSCPNVNQLGSGRVEWDGDFKVILQGKDISYLVETLKADIQNK